MDAFLEAFLNTEHTVLGRRLRPFSLASWFVLSSVQNPLLGDGGNDLADLIQAVKICAAPDPRTIKFAPTLREQWLYHWRRADQKFLERETIKFRAYLADFQSLPEFYEECSLNEDMPSTGRQLSAPWVLTRVCSLVSRANVTLDQAWSMPAGEAYWLDATLRELEGQSLRFFYPDEEGNEPIIEQSEDEIRAEALKNLGARRYAIWLKNREEMLEAAI